jgi:hypothetical protein
MIDKKRTTISESERAIHIADQILADAAKFRAAWCEREQLVTRLADAMIECEALRSEVKRLENERDVLVGVLAEEVFQ